MNKGCDDNGGSPDEESGQVADFELSSRDGFHHAGLQIAEVDERDDDVDDAQHLGES